MTRTASSNNTELQRANPHSPYPTLKITKQASFSLSSLHLVPPYQLLVQVIFESCLVRQFLHPLPHLSYLLQQLSGFCLFVLRVCLEGTIALHQRHSNLLPLGRNLCETIRAGLDQLLILTIGTYYCVMDSLRDTVHMETVSDLSAGLFWEKIYRYILNSPILD